MAFEDTAPGKETEEPPSGPDNSAKDIGAEMAGSDKDEPDGETVAAPDEAPAEDAAPETMGDGAGNAKGKKKKKDKKAKKPKDPDAPSRLLLYVASAGIVILLGGAGAFFLLSGTQDQMAATGTAAVDILPPGQKMAAGEGAVANNSGALQPSATPSSAMGGGPPPDGTMTPMAAANGGDPISPDAQRPAPVPISAPNAPVMVAAFDPAAITSLPEPGETEPLDATPKTELLEPSADGPLPRIASNGTRPFEAYSRPFDERDDRPRIALIVSGLGLSATATEAAIKYLPPAVTLAFDPYAQDLDRWVAAARARGHEVLLGLPMEPFDFPRSDPGPLGLMKTLNDDENLNRLHKVMGKTTSYVGFLGLMGSEFTSSETAVRAVADEMAKRGVMWVDALGPGKSRVIPIADQAGTPRARVDLILDRDPSKAGLGKALETLEATALKNAVAVATARPLPSTILEIAAWAKDLEERNLVLAPVSAVANKQFL
ncbi:MAG: divergent polysaccharide deacetylase family protein [Magnetospiraceae bacterium]